MKSWRLAPEFLESCNLKHLSPFPEMQRNIWSQHVDNSYCPPWKCPSCCNGTVILVRDSFKQAQTYESKAARKHEDWDPEWITYTFSAWALCSNAKCKEEFVITGDGGVEPGWDSEGDMKWSDTFYPRYIAPMPRVIEFPAKCPKDIVKELESSFLLLLSCPAASAGRIRAALELLLDHVGIARKPEKEGAVEYSLHKRIEEYSKNNAVLGGHLMALKWLGNTGSHQSNVHKSDLLDAFEILEHALSEIIENRSERLAALAKQLVEKHTTTKS